MTPPIKELESRVAQFAVNKIWKHIAKINHQINMSGNKYFSDLGALFTPLPLTTRMISSPGAVYGKETINYTTDTCPITLKWFNLSREAFLSESSQIYLELALLQNGVDQAYSIYNSFRKEKADAIHLSEFHHIEYEGKVNQAQNQRIALGLVQKIIHDLLDNNEADLHVFLTSRKLYELQDMADSIYRAPMVTYRDALAALWSETKDDRYKRFTMQDVFGSWEEIKLTKICGGLVGVSEFPLLEVPFYHATVEGSNPPVADNTDLIWPGYREFIGSGRRVPSKKGLEKKAAIFNLPRTDYQPYLQTRQFAQYTPTSGFGLGWERLVHGILEMPFIWSASPFPRVDTTLKP